MITPAQRIGLQHVIELAKATHNTVGSTFAQNPKVMECNAISMQHIGNAQDLLDRLSVTSGTDYFPSFPGTIKPAHEQIVLIYAPALTHKFVLAKFIQEKSRECTEYDFEGGEVWDEKTQKYYWPESFYVYTHDAIQEYCWHQLDGLKVERWWAVPMALHHEYLSEAQFYFKPAGAEIFTDYENLVDQIDSDVEPLTPVQVQRQLNINLTLTPLHFVRFPPAEGSEEHILSFADPHSAGVAIRDFKLNNPD